MKKILTMGSAFIGIIVGAGFASGQEILQYFTSFGYQGTIAAIIATALFAYLGMILARLGSRMQTTSHKDVIYKMSGRYLGLVVDAIIVFTLFGVGVVMIAGAGSILHQQFGFAPFVGNLLMTILIFITAIMNVDRVIQVISSITPFLIIAVLIVCVYALITFDSTFAELNAIAIAQPSAVSHWLYSAINYVSFNIAVGASMTIVMGGTEKNEKIASLGGLVGGLGVGVLIILSHLAIFSKVDEVASFDMPTLKIVDDISPFLGNLMAIVLFAMVFSTAVSMFYAFAARFVNMEHKRSNIFVGITLIIAFGLSFVGFTNLVAKFYPLIGLLGLFLVVSLIIAPFRIKKSKQIS